MQYFSNAQLITGTNVTKTGPFVKVTALANSDVKIDSPVIAGTSSGGSNVLFTMKANTTIEGVHMKSITVDDGTVIAYRA